MLGLGLASSHAPALFCPPEVWPTVYAAIPDYMKGSQPHTAKDETPEVIRAQIKRSDANFAALRRELEAFKPDALVILGDDQGDMFDISNVPAFSVFIGESVWGSTVPTYVGEAPEKSRIHMPVHQDLARHILKGLVKRNFDPASNAIMRPLGRPERGISHAVVYPAPKLMPKYDIPIVPIFMNEYFPPMPSAARCFDLGIALRDIIDETKLRVAIYASGGLSHDPAGPRAGWIDEPLDRWVLERLENNEPEELKNLFTFDSDTLRGGTGEVRAWISVAAACGRPAKVVDYFKSHHAKVGLAWAYWPWPAEGAVRQAAE